jgi:hypothetical protein
MPLQLVERYLITYLNNMADNNFDLKGFLNDPKVQADKVGAIKYLQSKGIIDANGNPTALVQQNVTHRNTFDNLIQSGIGFLKGAGTTVANAVKSGSETFPLVGITGLSKNPEPVNTAIKNTQDVLKPTNQAQKVGGYVETGAEIAAPFVGGFAKSGDSLIKVAQDLYASALKPSTALSSAERSQVINTGLQEGIRLTENGVNKVAEKIGTWENMLGEAITNHGGAKIKTSLLKPFVDEAKRFLGETVDVAGSDNATKEIDAVYNNFVKKYGEELPTDVAQKLKTNTYQVIKKYYDRMAAPTIEASKQLARGLKENILTVAPEVGDINKRLASLYNFETVLDRTMNRMGNTNVLSLGGKLFLSHGGVSGIAMTLLNELFGSAGKSTTAIGLNDVGQFLSKLAPKEQSIFSEILSKVAGVGSSADVNNTIQNLKQ